MKELLGLLEFVQKRQSLTEDMTKTGAILNDGVFGPYRRPSMTTYNAIFEEEAQQLLTQLFRMNKTVELCFELAELYKFGINPYFPGLDVQSDYSKAAYWYVAAADSGHKKTLQFFHRMVPHYFIPNTPAAVVSAAIVDALVEQERLAKGCQGETLEERKRREEVNDFVLDLFLYPQDQELDEAFWLDTLDERFGVVSHKKTSRLKTDPKNDC